MKRFIAIAATAICCMGNEMPANASMQKSMDLIYRGNGAMDSAVYTLKSTGSVRSACPHLKVAADSYASAYVLYPYAQTLDLMKKANGMHSQYC